jgi:HSP20 family protein
MKKEKAMAELKEAPRPKTENGAGHTKDIAARGATAPAKVSGSPYSFMRRFAEEIDHLFEDFGFQPRMHMPRFFNRAAELARGGAGATATEWSPRIDILEREGQFVVRADLPGMSKDDVKVEVTDDLLTIHGERKQERKEEREGYRYSECSYGSFYRAIPLPEGADASKANADFRKGVLEIAIPAPSRHPQKARRLEVREGK